MGPPGPGILTYNMGPPGPGILTYMGPPWAQDPHLYGYTRAGDPQLYGCPLGPGWGWLSGVWGVGWILTEVRGMVK